MTYKIDFFLKGKLVRSDSSTADFKLAKDAAALAVKSCEADRTEVRDGNGDLMFHFPRMMRRA